jgi:hypothetical protein
MPALAGPAPGMDSSRLTEEEWLAYDGAFARGAA